MGKKTTTPANDDDGLLKSIVDNVRAMGTDLTAQFAETGGLVVQYIGPKKPRLYRSTRVKEIQRALKKEGLDTNTTRLQQVYCLVQLEPRAAELGIGVAARLGSLTRYDQIHEEPIWHIKKDDTFTADQCAKLVKRAIAEKWTAKTAGEEIAAIKGKKSPTPPRKGKSAVRPAQVLRWLKDHEAELAAAMVKDHDLRNAVDVAVSMANVKEAKKADAA